MNIPPIKRSKMYLFKQEKALFTNKTHSHIISSIYSPDQPTFTKHWLFLDVYVQGWD